MKLHVLFIAFMFVAIGLRGQTIGTDLNSDYYQLRVKTIEDFIGRFNYTHDPRGVPINKDETYTENRRKQLFYLLSDALIKNAENDSIFRRSYSNFANFVTAKTPPLHIKLMDKRCYVEAVCNIKYNKRPKQATLYMHLTYNVKKTATKWVIDSVNAPFLKIMPATPKNLKPINHNMDFMQLGKASDEYPQQFPGFAYDGFEPDDLSIFMYLVKHKSITIDYVEKSIFHFNQISGYRFTVEKTKSQPPHTGWLITNFKKVKPFYRSLKPTPATQRKVRQQKGKQKKSKLTLYANNDTIKELVKKEISRLGFGANLNHIDVSKVTNMEEVFFKSKFNGDISKWDTSKVTNMSRMFFRSKFEGYLSDWNVSKVKDMTDMFKGSALERRDKLPNWYKPSE